MARVADLVTDHSTQPGVDRITPQAYQHTDVLGMRIGGVDRLRDVTREALLAQAVELGLGTTLGDRLLVELAERFPPSLEAAQARAGEEGWAAAVTERIASASRERAEQIIA